MIFETFRQAIQNVWSNKLRTFLTMLGIIIGVMAVIVIVGLGNGMTKSMRDSFSALGTNTLSIQVWGYGSRTVPVEEMYDICQRHSDLIKAVSPQIEFSGNARGTLKIGTTSYRWSNMSGVDENFTEMKNYQIVQGRGLQYMDMQDNKQVCVIGDYLNRVAFGGNGVGQTLKIGANKFRVVGVLSAKVSDPTMQQGSDDDCVYLPYTTVMRLSSQSMVDCYTAMMADDRATVDEAYAGDIVGLFDPGIFSIGDTVCSGKRHVQYPQIPTFAPEMFARITQVDTLKRKQFVKGMEELAQEGAIQIFRELGAGMESVIVGVVGVLQFEVLERRLKAEYRVEVRRQPLPYTDIRWIQNDPDTIDIPALSLTRDTLRVEDMRGGKLLLFTSPWNVDWATDHNPDLILSEFGNVAF